MKFNNKAQKQILFFCFSIQKSIHNKVFISCGLCSDILNRNSLEIRSDVFLIHRKEKYFIYSRLTHEKIVKGSLFSGSLLLPPPSPCPWKAFFSHRCFSPVPCVLNLTTVPGVSLLHRGRCCCYLFFFSLTSLLEYNCFTMVC